MPPREGIYGLLAEFNTPGELVHAKKEARRAGFSACFGMVALNSLPQPYHPLFNSPNFRNGATTDKFFLCLEATDPLFSPGETRAFLEQFPAVSVVEVDH